MNTSITISVIDIDICPCLNLNNQNLII